MGNAELFMVLGGWRWVRGFWKKQLRKAFRPHERRRNLLARHNGVATTHVMRKITLYRSVDGKTSVAILCGSGLKLLFW